VSQPTEIYLNEEYYYTNGYLVSVVPSQSTTPLSNSVVRSEIHLFLFVWRVVVQAKSPGKNLMWVYALPTATDGATITVTISPK
jgi:hypothetical protein